MRLKEQPADRRKGPPARDARQDYTIRFLMDFFHPFATLRFLQRVIWGR